MIDRNAIRDITDEYMKKQKDIKIGAIASHSALDTFDGAVEEGFFTHAFVQKGRENPYTRYFRSKRDDNGNIQRGMVDDYTLLNKFRDITADENIEKIIKNNILFVTNRSLTSYLGVEAVEDEFKVPLVGSRNLLASEERGEERDYYWLLEKAGMPYPEKIENPDNIDGLTIVKMHHAVKKLERGFFTCSSPEEYYEKAETLIKQGVITEEALKEARMEKYIIGPVFNLDFFYSPLEEEMEKIELLGIDWRFESSLDGHVRLPAQQQLALNEKQRIPEYTVTGHNSATLRESLLGKAFEMAEKYVEASKKYYDPGIIGPFCLQTCVDKDMNFYIYDVAPRIGGGTNVHMSVGHPYGNSLWRRNMSTGRRLAMEIRRAIDEERLDEIVT